MASNATLNSILQIIQAALLALSAVPAVGGDAVLASVFVDILQKALQAYSQAAGAPLDLTKIPLETPVP